jgi:hypothetical protein
VGWQWRLEAMEGGGSGKMEGRQHFDLRREEEKGKKKKENGRFHESTYIHQLTNEYRRVIPVSPASPIFIGEAMSPMNIVHVYSSVTWLHR